MAWDELQIVAPSARTVGHAARRRDGAVGLDRPAISGGQDPGACRRRTQRREIASLGDVLITHDLARPHRLELFRRVGQSGARGPFRLQDPRRADCIPFALGHHGQEALNPHRACAADPGDGRLVRGHERGAQRRRSDDPSVKHAGQNQVLQIAVVARHLRWHVGPGERFTNEPVALRRLQGCLRVDLHVERALAYQLAVAHRDATVLRADDAIDDLEIPHRLAEPLGRLGDERMACRGRRQAKLHAPTRDAVTARGGTLVRRERGVTLDHRDAFEGHVELLADELAHGDAPASPDVYLADEDGHRAIGVHGQERVEHVWSQRLAEKAIGAGHGLSRRPRRAVQAEADDQHPARGEEAPSRDAHGVHLSALPGWRRRRASPRASRGRGCRIGTGCRPAPPAPAARSAEACSRAGLVRS